MDIILAAADFFIHLDKYLSSVIASYGILTYGLLFIIIFFETGLIIAPFLPGDSLLFAAGSFAAIDSLNIFWLAGLLSIAAILGDTVNYWIGYFLGKKLIESKNRLIKQKYLIKSREFYEHHGVKTIILARFVPIVRTFAPFLAGIGKMRYSEFVFYNIIGGLIWVLIFVLGGFFFGRIPVVKNNFSFMILIIIIISIMPVFFGILKTKNAVQNSNIS